MKKILVVLILFSSLKTSAQSWNFKSGGNAFDGKYKTSSIRGKGTDFPYNKPLLVVNLFKEESLNFYIDDAGYFQDVEKTKILLNFDTEKNIIYECDYFSKSDDGKTIFLNTFINKESNKKLSALNFIEKLKNSNKLYVRISDNYGQNDLLFSLNGSSKAIDYVISKKYREEYLAYQKEIEDKAKEKLDKEILLNTRILTMINNAGIKDSNEWNNLFKKIDKTCYLYNINKKELDTINFNIKKYSSSVILLNKNGKELKEIESIQYIIPNFIKNYRKKINEKFITKINLLLSKYDLNKTEKENVIEKINSNAELFEYSYKVSDIDSLFIDVDYEYEFASLELFDTNKKSLKRINIKAENYVNKKVNRLEKIGKENINSILREYKFTETEKSLLTKEFSQKELREIGDKEVSSIKFEFSSYCVTLKFNSNEKEIKYIPICDKKIRRKMKKRYDK